jgi:hypothetical protein
MVRSIGWLAPWRDFSLGLAPEQRDISILISSAVLDVALFRASGAIPAARPRRKSRLFSTHSRSMPRPLTVAQYFLMHLNPNGKFFQHPAKEKTPLSLLDTGGPTSG